MSFKDCLLIEDEIHLAQTLLLALNKMGIPTQNVPTLEAARSRLKSARPELIVLDLGLPDGDGLDFCKELRGQLHYAGMILMLTARGDTQDRIAGYQVGADDYLAKPFSWDELKLRIEALGRRKPNLSQAKSRQTPESTEPQLWDLEEKRLRIFGPSGWEELTPLEYKLVSHLIRSDGAIVSREELLREVWGFHLLPKTRTVDQFLGRIRKRFETDPENPEHFLTIRGAGYRFCRSKQKS